ncbi:MAG TPA: hypothetical protein VFW03_11515 [Gemmatimonadaceae bacterium]|nr:hypothetical protein [Gemmatimonadaceae bacterium]
MHSLRTALALALASAALVACSDQPNSAPTDPSGPRVSIPAAVNGDLLTLLPCDINQLKADSRAFTSPSDVLSTIANALQTEIGRRGQSETATDLVLDGLSRIAAIRGTANQNSDITALVFDRLVKGWLACAKPDFVAGAEAPNPPVAAGEVGGFGPALGSHWVFEVRGKDTDPAGGAYERNKPALTSSIFWALEQGEATWAASIGGSLKPDRVFIYGYQTSSETIPAKSGSSFDHFTIPKISPDGTRNPTFTLSMKVGLCGVEGLGTGRRVNHDGVFLPLESNFACTPPAVIADGSSIYAFRLLNPISLAQRAIEFFGPQQLHAALGGVVGSRPKGLSPSSVYDLSAYLLTGLDSIADGRTSKPLALKKGGDVTVTVSFDGALAPKGTPVTVSVVGNKSSIAFFKDGSNGTPGPTVTRYANASGVVSFGDVYLTKAGGYILAFQVTLPNGTGGFDFKGANVIQSNSFNYQGK